MKFSEAWLREWVNPEVSSQELMHQVTMAGLEVDGAEPVAADFSGVVVAEITGCEHHPNADKLRVCQVSDGSETYQVVCGAPNARVGIKVAFAQVGAVLPGDFKIKKAKLRQVESFGMLCSEKELGLSDEHDGIIELAADAPVGTVLRDYLQLDDLAIEVDLTPNRADCLSLRGIAREVAVLNNLKATAPVIEPVAAKHDNVFEVQIDAPEACPRYVGRVLKSVDVSQPTPVWMVERLRRSGIRSIDPVVDVTNYVLLELGQPMHGFDLDTLKGKIIIRRAEANEELTLLDGQTLKLDSSVLVIADESGPLAMAGIMGGEHSGVSEKTKNVFLESAFFEPVDLAGKARKYGLHTDSSHRFERGVDSELQALAVERATELLVEICGAEPGPLVVRESSDHLPKPATIQLSKAKLASSLGIELADERVVEILTGLEFTEVADKGEDFEVVAPSWRFDMAIPEDLVEEIARVYGYNNIPVTAPSLALKPQGVKEQATPEAMLVDRMVSLGYQEAITFSFVEPEGQKQLFPNLSAIELANPISADMSVMRVSLWPGLLKAMEYNLKRQQNHLRMFEMGLRFRKDGDDIEQTQMLAAAVTGPRLPQGWFESGEGVDFYDLKGDLEQLLGLVKGVDFDFVPGKHSALHPGQTARIERDGKLIGYIGALHPNLAKAMGFKQDVYLFEINLERTLPAELPAFKPLSKHPASTRDLAVVVDEEVAVQEVLDTVQELAGNDLINLTLFDIYRGKGIDSKRKSLAMGLTWQNPSRTLTDEEINRLMESIITALQNRLDAVLRG